MSKCQVQLTTRTHTRTQLHARSNVHVHMCMRERGLVDPVVLLPNHFFGYRVRIIEVGLYFYVYVCTIVYFVCCFFCTNLTQSSRSHVCTFLNIKWQNFNVQAACARYNILH